MGVECRDRIQILCPYYALDSPEEGGSCRGVDGGKVPRQDSNPESLLRLGLPNSMEEGGSCRGVEGVEAGWVATTWFES
jgi:hypothetical protein